MTKTRTSSRTNVRTKTLLITIGVVAAAAAAAAGVTLQKTGYIERVVENRQQSKTMKNLTKTNEPLSKTKRNTDFGQQEHVSQAYEPTCKDVLLSFMASSMNPTPAYFQDPELINFSSLIHIPISGIDFNNLENAMIRLAEQNVLLNPAIVNRVLDDLPINTPLISNITVHDVRIAGRTNLEWVSVPSFSRPKMTSNIYVAPDTYQIEADIHLSDGRTVRLYADIDDVLVRLYGAEWSFHTPSDFNADNLTLVNNVFIGDDLFGGTTLPLLSETALENNPNLYQNPSMAYTLFVDTSSIHVNDTKMVSASGELSDVSDLILLGVLNLLIDFLNGEDAPMIGAHISNALGEATARAQINSLLEVMATYHLRQLALDMTPFTNLVSMSVVSTQNSRDENGAWGPTATVCDSGESQQIPVDQPLYGIPNSKTPGYQR